MKLAGPQRPAYGLYRALWTALDWFFPPSCGGCGQMGTRWCSSCQQQVDPIRSGFCSRCGELLPVNGGPASSANGLGVCGRCQVQTPSFDALRSYATFDGPLRDAIHRLKYQQDIGLGESLSKHLIELYNQLKWDIDLVVPVPLNVKRMQERGYNQSDLLGRPLAYAIQKPYRTNVLHRNRDTRSQVGLSAAERQQNVHGAFSARTDQVKGRAILVIDDVTTTGSTINACAQALRDAGASAVFGITLARALSQADADNRPTTLHT